MKTSKRPFQVGDRVVTEFAIAVLERYRPNDGVYELATIAKTSSTLRLKLFVQAQALLFHAPPEDDDLQQQKEQKAVTKRFHQTFCALEKVRRLNLVLTLSVPMAITTRTME
mmetsp:Transcript_14138/g.39084  ORF Transcript_14138/g.39084 Transcript_14138/m.39084 type:complete len:112 (-) Transcript_14138:2700-3035(-)